MAIKNLIFDIGSVLVSYRGEEMLEKRGLGKEALDEFNRKVFRDPLWQEFDYENIPFEEVVDRYAQKYPELEEDIRWLFAHAYLMPVYRPRVWTQLHELKKAGYGIYLLTNYSSVLMDMHLHGLPFWKEIDGMVASFEIHEVKPHAIIYQTLMDRYGLKKEECVFFDDRKENVEGAEAFGIRSYQITREQQLIDLMKQFVRDRLLDQAITYEAAHESDASSQMRPVYHLTPRIGWMNDPNGFSYYKGQYHLFYQYYPYDSFWGPMHWGHAVSPDLLHWTYLPAALAPDQPYDQDGCFSGSAIELPDGRQLLMYTAVNRTAPGEEGESKASDIRGLFTGSASVWHDTRRPAALVERQTQALAIGDGLTYEKVSTNPVLDDKDLPEGVSIADFRDPKMVRLADGTYRCYCVANIPQRGGCLLQFVSEDGLSWQYRSTMLVNDGVIGRMWECPDFFHMDDRDVLLASAQDMLADEEFHSGDGSFLMTGSYDDESGRFIPEDLRNVDYGPDFYAEQTVLTPDGRRVMIAWMQNWGTVNLRTDPHLWYGQMTTPREIFFQEGVFCQQPIRELKELRQKRVAYRSEILSDEERAFRKISGRALWLDVEISDCSLTNPLRKFVIKLARSEQFHTDLIYDTDEQTLCIDRRYSGSRKGAMQSTQTRVGRDNGKLHLTILLDRYSIEVFVGRGEKTLTMTLPTQLSADEIRFAARGAASLDITAWDLRI